MALLKKKICLLGSFAVGKTSLIERFVYDRFDEKYLTTIGVRISQKILPPIQNPESGEMLQHIFLIWDMAGLDKFDRVTISYLRGASGAIAVTDLTRPDTLGSLTATCNEFLSVNPDAKLLIVGNKLDIFEGNQKTVNELSETAESFSTHFLTTSAKTGEQVENAFLKLSALIGK
ncbi:MAG: Rab family GTPase [Desulfobacterales bacterium]|jgi:small GTP-binding protein